VFIVKEWFGSRRKKSHIYMLRLDVVRADDDGGGGDVKEEEEDKYFLIVSQVVSPQAIERLEERVCMQEGERKRAEGGIVLIL
jgi:hypothetical protein